MTESEYFAYHMQQEWKQSVKKTMDDILTSQKYVKVIAKHIYQRADSNVVFVNFKRLRKD